MVDFGNTAKERWVCPNDRQLALRAKLKTGWSVKTQTLGCGGLRKITAPLNDTETDTIKQVIKRAEMLELTEQERVGKLVDRLENMRKNAMGNGTNQCILCGDHFGMLGAPSLLCHDCKKSVCSKCGIDTVSAHKEPISLCKICSETREMWKKSGAWFYKGLPKYTLPEKKSLGTAGKYGGRRIQRLGLERNTWSKPPSIVAASKVAALDEEESSSDDEYLRRSRQNRLRGYDETDAPANPTHRHGSIVTFDLSGSGGGGGTLQSQRTEHQSQRPEMQSQRSESLSLPSDGEAQTDLAYSDVDRSGPRGCYRREDLSGSTISFAESTASNAPQHNSRAGSLHDSRAGSLHDSRAGSLHDTRAGSLHDTRSGSLHDTRSGSLHATPSSWDVADHDANRNRSPSPYQLTHPAQIRRDSQLSVAGPRDWYGSEDRLSLASSTFSGHRTVNSASDPIEETINSKPSYNNELGSLELSLLYDPLSTSLHCTLHRAKGLKAMDINGLSDPFCRLNLLPTEGKSNQLRTKTVHKTRNPEFNETLTFYGITDRDINQKMLHILILDDDKYGQDLMGESRLPLSRLRPEISHYMHVYLEPRQIPEQPEQLWGTRGKILITLCYSTRKRALVVGVVRCVNLTPMDNNGLSDPFVKLRLKPDPHHRKCKTSVKWKNLNPTFSEEFVFDTKMTDLPKQTLLITVWDKDYGKSNDYLGGLQLGWDSKGERLRHWVDLIKFPDHKHEGWHNLGEDPID